MISNNEFDELMAQLEAAGWQPMTCDTPVPYFRNGVPAGYPQAPGEYDGEYEMIPKALLKLCDFIVAVKGDSMRDADINNGDDVIVKKNGDYEDGDIVVACLDGETTLKSICHYEDDVWLVPANEAYPPIRLSDYQSVYILGKVTSVRKRPQRMSYSDVQRKLEKVRKKTEEQKHELPKELSSKKARRILDRAIEEGLLTDDYQRRDDVEWWKMACLADTIGDELGLSNKWVVFCSFWRNKNLRKYKTDKEGLTDYKNFQKILAQSII